MLKYGYLNYFNVSNNIFIFIGRTSNIRMIYKNLGKYTMDIKYNKFNGKINSMDIKVSILYIIINYFHRLISKYLYISYFLVT